MKDMPLANLISVPYDDKDPSPCENCQALRLWSQRQIAKKFLKELDDDNHKDSPNLD